MIMRNTANPRRTTLSHLEDADELAVGTVSAEQQPQQTAATEELPEQTANPSRTVLADAALG